MKKVIFIFLTLSYCLIYSQSLELSDENGKIDKGGKVYVTVANNEEISKYIYVANVSNKDIYVKVKKENIDLLPGVYSTFCWGSCFSEEVKVSPNSILIPAGKIDKKNFYADYAPMNNDGVSIIRYTFFDEKNPDDSTDVYIHFYSSPASISEKTSNNVEISAMFPCPAVNQCSFYYQIPANSKNSILTLIDITGNIVQKHNIPQGKGKFTLDVSELSSGIYFYSLTVDGVQIITRKLFIQK